MSNVAPKRKVSFVLVILSMALGIVALLASVGGLSSVFAEANYHSTTGVIVDLDLKVNPASKPRTKNRCSPIIEFVANEQTYTSGPDQYSVYGKGTECRYSVGDEIIVRYDSSDPTKSTVSDSAFDWMMGAIGGAIALLFGVIFPFRMISKSRSKTLVSD